MDKRILSEIDLLPNGIKSTPAKTAWEALSNGLVNIQQAMKYRETERIPDARSAENGRRHVVTPKDVEEIVRYIKTTINNCLSSTFPKFMLKESITKQETDMKTENRNRNVVRLTESKLKQIIAESVKRVLREQQQFSSLREFMNDYYNNDSSCSSALELLMDDSYIQKQGWKRVFHEGYGEGVCSPAESIVAVFDVDDIPKYHSYGLYRYNPRAWKDTDGDGWDRIYAGDNGEDFEVEPISR